MAKNISASIVCNHNFSKCFLCGSIDDLPMYHFVQWAKLLEIPPLIFCNQNDTEEKKTQQHRGNHLVSLSSLYQSIGKSVIAEGKYQEQSGGVIGCVHFQSCIITFPPDLSQTIMYFVLTAKMEFLLCKNGAECWKVSFLRFPKAIILYLKEDTLL